MIGFQQTAFKESVEISASAFVWQDFLKISFFYTNVFYQDKVFLPFHEYGIHSPQSRNEKFDILCFSSPKKCALKSHSSTLPEYTCYFVS